MSVDIIPKPWTAAEDILIERLWKEGHSASQIGKRLGRTKNMIVGKVSRMGLDARPSPIIGLQKPRASRPVVVRLKAPPPSRIGPVIARAGACCWPIGEVKSPAFRFCGSPAVILGKPYCAEHCARAYQGWSATRVSGKGVNLDFG
jgi:GcrA cell cycle regulator